MGVGSGFRGMVEGEFRVIDSRAAAFVDELPPSQFLCYLPFDEVLFLFDVAVAGVALECEIIGARTWHFDLLCVIKQLPAHYLFRIIVECGQLLGGDSEGRAHSGLLAALSGFYG